MECKTAYKIRRATADDAHIVFKFIMELAKYEKLEHEVTGSVSEIHNHLATSSCHAILLETNDSSSSSSVLIPVGFALYFYNFSTFRCQKGIYLEDLFVLPEYRKRGFGKALINHLRVIANEEDCGRVEWSCLKWNTPSINFYESLGAEQLSEWTVFRLHGQALKNS